MSTPAILTLAGRTSWKGAVERLTSVILNCVEQARVGKVSSHDATVKMISVIPIPEYPVHNDEDRDEDLFLPPYNLDGTLEVGRTCCQLVREVGAGFKRRQRTKRA